MIVANFEDEIMLVKVKIVEKILPDGVPWRPVETRQPAVRVRGSTRVAKSGHRTHTRATRGLKTVGLPEPVLFPRLRHIQLHVTMRE